MIEFNEIWKLGAQFSRQINIVVASLRRFDIASITVDVEFQKKRWRKDETQFQKLISVALLDSLTVDFTPIISNFLMSYQLWDLIKNHNVCFLFNLRHESELELKEKERKVNQDWNFPPTT